MVKFDKVKLSYTCSASPPNNVRMDRSYSMGRDDKGFFFTDGNYIEHVKESDLWYIKMLFTPNGMEWKDVVFDDKVKQDVKFTKLFDNK